MTSLALAPREALPDDGSDAGRLFAAHAEWLERYCARQLGSASEAEDAVQTTFLYALRALRRGVVPECEEAWLTTIAKNVCRTQRRTEGRRGVACDLDLDRIALAAPQPDDALLASELPSVLRALPETQRDALVMRELRGMDASEIGSRLGLTPTATHALLTRARRSCASALTSAVGRPLSALNVALLLETLRAQLKALAGGASAKAAVGVAAVSVIAGGAVVTQSFQEQSSPPAAVVDGDARTPRTEPRSHVPPAPDVATSRPATKRRNVPPAATTPTRADGRVGAARAEARTDAPVATPAPRDEAAPSPERPQPLPQNPTEPDPLPDLRPVGLSPLPELPVDEGVPPLPPLPTEPPPLPVPPPPPITAPVP